jgi:hypothetical protein
MIKTMNVLLINVYYEGKILNTPMSFKYIIGASCTIFVTNNINFEDLRERVHTFLGLHPNQYKSTIKARINTTQSNSGVYYHSLFCISLENIWEVVKMSVISII